MVTGLCKPPPHVLPPVAYPYRQRVKGPQEKHVRRPGNSDLTQKLPLVGVQVEQPHVVVVLAVLHIEPAVEQHFTAGPNKGALASCLGPQSGYLGPRPGLEVQSEDRAQVWEEGAPPWGSKEDVHPGPSPHGDGPLSRGGGLPRDERLVPLASLQRIHPDIVVVGVVRPPPEDDHLASVVDTCVSISGRRAFLIWRQRLNRQEWCRGIRSACVPDEAHIHEWRMICATPVQKHLAVPAPHHSASKPSPCV
mmetsp:Transcript_47126/g.84366  ORF Transcript_47126/g.84366 Transcript_47126/m.84366 type:complete len:250 (-) Transcript_47126:569-1318(-)